MLEHLDSKMLSYSYAKFYHKHQTCTLKVYFILFYFIPLLELFLFFLQVLAHLVVRESLI